MWVDMHRNIEKHLGTIVNQILDWLIDEAATRERKDNEQSTKRPSSAEVVQHQAHRMLKVSGARREIPNVGEVQRRYQALCGCPDGAKHRSGRLTGHAEVNLPRHSVQIFVEIADPTKLMKLTHNVRPSATESGKTSLWRIAVQQESCRPQFFHPSTGWYRMCRPDWSVLVPMHHLKTRRMLVN